MAEQTVPAAPIDMNIGPGDAIQVSTPDLTNFRAVDFDFGNLGFDLNEYLTPQSNSNVPVLPSPPPGKVFSIDANFTASNDWASQLQQLMSAPAMPMMPSHSPRSLSRRTNAKPGAKRTANLLLHTLKSYSAMMLQHNNLPPFIHPQLFSINQDKDMEALYNCISLMHMISHRLPGSRALFWKNVRQECERIRDTYLLMNKWELLAALQALSVYTIVRIDEGETEHNNLDSLMQNAIILVAATFNGAFRRGEYDSGASSTSDRLWKDWIFEESSRRLCTINQVLNMIVYFEPAMMCDMHLGLLLAPLPAKKQLWEANSEFAWKADVSRELDQRVSFGLAADGELVKLDKNGAYCYPKVLAHEYRCAHVGSKTLASWEDWCSKMDNLGGLVMLAASLFG